MKDDTSQHEDLATVDNDSKQPDDISTYGKYTVKSYFVGEEDITELIINYIDHVASLVF